ncbi:MAG: cobaltochelatase subunit CobN, partial [Pseudomonadota bacterium]
MQAEGYEIGSHPRDGDALMRDLRSGPTNRGGARGVSEHTYPIADYTAWFEQLPEAARDEITARWGAPEDDPFVIGDAFHLAVRRYGNVVVGIQPVRGYNIDPKATYHDPALVPPHGYLAFYRWLRESFGAHAVVHFGKHGNLEWLPGKALALSNRCWPDIALGSLPNIYPFIVNDPGEGAQAKRRTSAVVVDHMTPPMTRAETYGPLRLLEGLLDEYAEAAPVDPKRAERLAKTIVDEAERTGLAEDLKIERSGALGETLQRLDAALCDLKELQIRGGLHVFGASPVDDARCDLLAALVRVPRGEAPEEQSFQRALANELGLIDFDPLDCDLGATWTGARPCELERMSTDPWRTNGDTVERIEAFAISLLRDPAGGAGTAPGPTSRAILAHVAGRIAPDLDACGARETSALLAALDGRFVAPGPSGAPTRGR